jgi:predicted small metal-binding protein
MTESWDAETRAAAYSIACGDVMPGCTARFGASSEPELMEQVIEHARSAHGITEITPEVASAVKAVIVRR